MNEPSGRLLVLDLEQGNVIRSCEIFEPPYREKDPNPRGGFRGLKGMSIDGDIIALANSSTVFLYDKQWCPLNYFWHPSCAGIHDIKLLDQSIWVTCSRNDLLIDFDFEGNIVKYYDLRRYYQSDKSQDLKVSPFLSEKDVFAGKINFRDPSTHDPAVTDLMHVNSLAFLNDDILVSCGLLRKVDNFYLHKLNDLLKRTFLKKLIPSLIYLFKNLLSQRKGNHFEATPVTKEKTQSLIIKLTAKGETAKCLAVDGCKVPSHSIRILNDRTGIYLDSTTGNLIHFNPETNQVLSSNKIGRAFLRGARELPDGCLLLGDHNDLIHYDLYGNKVLSRINLTKNPAEAVFDIELLPEGFKLPPESFVKLHKNENPVFQT